MYIDITGHSVGAINFSYNVPKYENGKLIEFTRYYIGYDASGLAVFSYNGTQKEYAPLYAATPMYGLASDNEVVTVKYLEHIDSGFFSKIIIKGGSANSWS